MGISRFDGGGDRDGAQPRRVEMDFDVTRFGIYFVRANRLGFSRFYLQEKAARVGCNVSGDADSETDRLRVFKSFEGLTRDPREKDRVRNARSSVSITRILG